MNKTMMISIVSTVVLIGCIFTHQKPYPFPASEITVEGDTIYCAGKPFAKLWTIDSNFYMTAENKLFSTQVVSGLGLVIHYYSNDKDVWIHPEKGLSIYHDGKEYTDIEHMQQEWSKALQQARTYDNEGHWKYERNKLPVIHIGGRQMEKEDLIRSGVIDVRISSDGKYIYYKAQGMLWNSSHKYFVECGAS